MPTMTSRELLEKPARCEAAPGPVRRSALRRGARIAATLAAAGLLIAGCSRRRPSEPAAEEPAGKAAAAAKGAPWFEEIAQKAGVRFTMKMGHRPGRYLMPEIKGGGVGLLDYDGDGLLDIFCVQAGSLYPDNTNRPGHKLFRNLGGLRFEDVTKKAGIVSNGAYGMGCACADYDRDGDVDIYVTAYGRNTLYRNNGDGTFTDATEAAGVSGLSWGVGASFTDYDGDGWLDLYIANYVRWSPQIEVDCYSEGGRRDYCSPVNYRAPAIDTLYHNRGDGTFEEVTTKAGVRSAYGYGLMVVGADLTSDGLPDFYVADDATPNLLWVNRGDGTFVNEAMPRGCAVNGMGLPEASMGISVVDTFERGVFDLFITHLVGEMNRLYYRTNDYFVDLIAPRGPNAPSLPYTSFGQGFYDFDNDGHLDLFVSNGRVKRVGKAWDPQEPYSEPNTLMRGLGGGRFAEVTPQGGTDPVLYAAGRGAAFGDLDNDGRVDAVVINREKPLYLLHNVTGGGRWIGFRLLDKKGFDAVGAITELQAGGRSQWRYFLLQASYASTNDPRIHYGLGPVERVERLIVRWPFGKAEAYGPFEANRYYTIRQGTGRPWSSR